MKLSELEKSGVPQWFKDGAPERREREQEQRRLESLPPLYIVHTVHGTFASTAEWIEPTGEFGQALRSGLGWRVRIEPFVWTGANSVVARFKAARDLRRRLDDKLVEFKEARHVVVAHSHGGNIVFMALNSTDLAGRLLGVVTLATPFLTARTRPGRPLMDPGAGIFAGLFAGWTVLLIGLYRGTGWALWPWAAGAAIATFAVLSLGAFLNERMQRHAARICEQMPATALDPGQVAIVRVQGDEATAAIAGARVAGTLADLVWRLSTNHVFDWLNTLLTAWDYGGVRSMMDTIQRDVWKGDGSFARTPPALSPAKSAWQAVTQVLPILLLQIFREGDRKAQLIAMVFVGVYGLPAALALATVVLGIPFAILSSLSLLPCGKTVPLAGPYLDLAAEASPPGSWTVTSLPGSSSGHGLYHSEAHENPAVPAFVADWILRRSVSVS